MEKGNSLTLNLASWCKEGTHVLGPGLRFAIWTQGCLKACPGCVSPSFRPLVWAQRVDGKALAEYVIRRTDFEGISISGGEPFLQASALSRFIRLIRARRKAITVIVFTGFLLENLVWPEAAELLDETDLLIDGPFLKEQICDQGLRGSSNQRFHYLTSRLEPYKEFLEFGPREREIQYEGDAIFPVGIPPQSGLFGDLFEHIK